MRRFSHNWWARVIRVAYYILYGPPSWQPWPVSSDWEIYELARWLSGYETDRIRERWMRDLNG